MSPYLRLFFFLSPVSCSYLYFLLPFASARIFLSCCVFLGPRDGYRTARPVLAVCLPYVCLLVFLFLCRNSVGPAAGDMTGRTTIRRNLVPSGLGLRIFVYVSCLFSIFRLRILLVSSGASHGYFQVLFGLPGIRDDIAQLV